MSKRSRRSRRLLPLAPLLALCAAWPLVTLAQPPARQIPGITAKDPFPRACVDCHVNRPDLKMDTRLSVLMTQWKEKVDPDLLAKSQAAMPPGAKLKGKHPGPGTSLQNVPAGCIKCHSATSKIAPPMAPMMHVIHLTGGGENRFLKEFQGECTHCHKFNAATGRWSVPSGAEK